MYRGTNVQGDIVQNVHSDPEKLQSSVICGVKRGGTPVNTDMSSI